MDTEQFTSIRRNPVSTTSDVNFDETNPFAYLQLDFKPASWVKLTGGFRYDHFFYDIEDNFRSLATSPNEGFLSPRAGISVSPVKGLDFFGNYGQGFRPPSAITELGLDPNLEAAENETIELGLQYNSPDGVWHFLFDAYKTTFTNELQGQPFRFRPSPSGPPSATASTWKRASEYGETAAEAFRSSGISARSTASS